MRSDCFTWLSSAPQSCILLNSIVFTAGLLQCDHEDWQRVHQMQIWQPSQAGSACRARRAFTLPRYFPVCTRSYNVRNGSAGTIWLSQHQTVTTPGRVLP